MFKIKTQCKTRTTEEFQKKMSDSDSLFGDDQPLVATSSSPTRTRISLSQDPDLFANTSAVKIVKLPPKSLLSTDLWSDQPEQASRAVTVPHIAWQPGANGVQSNARLVEWEDGSFTLMVGCDGFKIMERVEDVHLYDASPSGLALAGVARRQLILTPASLDSRISLASKMDEDKAVQRPKTQITSAQRTSDSLPLAAVPKALPKRPAAMTTAFLEEEISGSSIGAIKRNFKRQRVTSSPKRRPSSSDSGSDSSSNISSGSSSSSSNPSSS